MVYLIYVIILNILDSRYGGKFIVNVLIRI